MFWFIIFPDGGRALEVIVRFLGEKGTSYLQVEEDTYLKTEKGGKYLTTSKIEYASVYRSVKEAQRVVERKTFLDWSMSKPKYEIVEVPSKRLELEPDERIVFFNDGSMFDKDKLGVWEQVAVREIDYIEAAGRLAKSMPTHGNPTMYCWEESFWEGSIKVLYGVVAENREKFIVNHLMGGFFTVPHCGVHRVVNSGYRMPVNLPSGELRWVNPREYYDLIENETTMMKKYPNPAFETNLNLSEFFAKVDEIKARRY